MIINRVIKELFFCLKSMLIFGISAFLLFEISGRLGIILAEKEAEILMNEQEMPKAMLEFIGMQQLGQFPARIEVFFLSILIFNFAVMGMIITHSIHTMRQGMESGSFGFLFSQVMKKRIFFVVECFRVMVVAFATWCMYVLSLFGVARYLLVGAEAAVVSKVHAILEAMSTWGLAVVVLLASISVLYGIKQSYHMHEMDFGLAIMGIGFLIGNAYKIPQYIGHKQVEQMVNAQQTMEVMRMMKEVRFACPLSWLNPFNIYNRMVDVEMIGSYVGVAAVVFMIAGVVFCLRDWWEV